MKKVKPTGIDYSNNTKVHHRTFEYIDIGPRLSWTSRSTHLMDGYSVEPTEKQNLNVLPWLITFLSVLAPEGILMRIG